MKTQRYGHLELGFTTELSLPEGKHYVTNPDLWNPVPPDSSGEWRSLGTMFCWSGNTGSDAFLMVKDHSPQRDLLVAPARFELLATVEWANLGYKVWRPVPPSDDYVALGIYVTGLYATPSSSTSGVVCVKKNHSGRTYARRGELSLPVYAFPLYEGLRYNLTPLYPHGDTEEHLILPAGTLSYTGVADPAPTATTWVLDLPAVVEKFDGPDTPDLENYNPPPETTVITDRLVTVPFYMVTDTARSTQWKLENSPFYKILRKRQFRLVRHVDYRGSGGGHISESVQQGVSQEKSEEFSLNTGLTVGVAVGVEASAKPFGIGASTSVETSISTSIETGYASRYGVTTMESKTVAVTYDVPAGHAGALWSESHELIPIRADDSMITNANLRFDSGSYVGRTYPHSPDRPPQVTDRSSTTAHHGHKFKDLWDIPADEITVTPGETR
ncbi:hypothetical protein ACFXO9_26960 [Nocardia tengchongensis]|uniref:hypothetical protein n=1 Tax=Nocardia tengchongensis TaxID=2055889 RepID=UPI0036B4F473